MTSIREAVRRLFEPFQPLEAGMYHLQVSPQDAPPYRLHLRLEPDGSGMLVINASTILHLNRTAAEYAYHMIKETPPEQAAKEISRRYRVSSQQALNDFQNISDRIKTLISTPDLDPESFLEFMRVTPHTNVHAPYRLDCAITYRLPEGIDPILAPTKNVSRELATHEWQVVLDKAWAAGVMHIIFTGGEPTLRQDLPDLIQHAEHNGQVTGLLTDGIRLTDPSYLEILLNTGLDHLVLLAAPDSQQFWQALEHALQADIYVAVHHTITAENATAADQFLHELAAKGVHALSLSAISIEFARVLNGLRNTAAQLGLSLLWDLPVPFSAFNPVRLEIQETQAANEVGESGRPWLYLEPDADIKTSQASQGVLGNFLTDPWASIQTNISNQ